MEHVFVSVALLSLAAVAGPAQASKASAFDGRWTSPKRNLIINIAPCGSAHCGTVVWASAFAEAEARKGGTPSLVGRQLISGVRPDGKGGYKGRAFLPKQNIHATATIRQAGPNAMIVKGCAMRVICKSQRWTRVG